VRPSPQFTLMRSIGLAPVVLAGYVSGNDTVWPTVGDAGDGVPMVIACVEFTVTVTVEVAGAVVVVLPSEPVVVVVTPAVAVTFAVLFVDNVVVAIPLASVFTTLELSEPASVVKVTGMPASALPPESVTFALIVDEPPLDDTMAGFALATMPPTAAEPTAILTVFAVATVAPPELAVMVAIPEEVPALNRVVARPFTSVCASAGSKEPRFVEKVTCVPLCGGVPAASRTCATISAVPLNPSALVAVDSVMVDPVGASSGTFSQESPSHATDTSTPVRRMVWRERVTMKTLTILRVMNLRGQASSVATRSSGYAMVALLVAMSIMAVMLTVAMPVWKHNVQREKEEELIFRGKQYIHAIELYGRKFANTPPPSLDALVEQRFLRKKFQDPITGQDFDLVRANQTPQPGTGGQPSATPGRGGAAGSAGLPAPAAAAPQTAGQRGISPIGSPGSNPIGGIVGVMSKSKEKSIRIYNGRTHYNEWVFVYQPTMQSPGGGVPGAGVPGQRGGQPGGPGPLGRGRGDGRGDGRGGPGRGGPGRGGPGFPGFPGGPAFPGTPGAPPVGGRGRG
jgi:type II secretory pathway pseudopilin PulG